MEHWTDEKVAGLLLKHKIITQNQHLDVLKEHTSTGHKVTQILLDNKITTAVKINNCLATAGCTDLDSYIPEINLIEKFKEDRVRKHSVMPLFILGSKVYVAMVNPQDFEAQQMIGFSSGYTQIRNIVANPSDITKMIDKFFGRRGAIMEAMREVNQRKDTAEEKSKMVTSQTVTDAPIVKLVDDYIERALAEDASDIHFEPQEDGLCVRMRIDGHLHTIETIPTSLIGPLTSRVKIISQLKIDLRMVPQDGRFSKIINGIELDFRTSSFPGIFGESIVLRMLKRKMRFSLEDLGLASSVLQDFKKVLNKDKGIFLVTGPTGCGKTTTLVSILSQIKNPTKKVITLENPVEYQIDGAVQGQIHPQAGFTFAKGLRAILRHDPNIIMVAEIRDSETASIALEAGLTGHFVLSTLHTNNAPGTIVRLLEMKVEPYILSSSILGVLAQRLVRTICPDCKEAYEPPQQILKSLGLRTVPSNLKLYRGKGCQKCRNTGYRGRVGIFELMLVTERMRQMILDRVTAADIEIESRKSGMRTLREDGIRKALLGITTLEEIFGVTQETSAQAD